MHDQVFVLAQARQMQLELRVAPLRGLAQFAAGKADVRTSMPCVRARSAT